MSGKVFAPPSGNCWRPCLRPRRARVAGTGRVHVDPAKWGRQYEPAPLLAKLRDAVVNGTEIEITYTKPAAGPEKRVIEPYGLVAKDGVWYVVAGESGIRTFRVSRVSDAEPTGRKAAKPEGFDLEAAWEAVTRRMTERMPAFVVDFTVRRDSAPWVELSMAWMLGVERLDAAGDAVCYRDRSERCGGRRRARPVRRPSDGRVAG